MATHTPLRPQQANGRDDQLRESILQAFPSRLLDEGNPALDGLASLLRVYGSSITAEDLFYKTEAVMVSEKQQSVTRDVVDLVKSSIQSQWESKMRSKSTIVPSKVSNTPATKSRAGLGALFGVQTPHLPATPLRPAQSRQVISSVSSTEVTPSAPPPQSSSQQIIETLNPHIPVSRDRALPSTSSRVSLAIGTNPKAWNYRYMFERPGMKGQALDDAIETTTRAILSAYQIPDDELADPSVTTQENVTVVGRIAPILEREKKAAFSESHSQAPKLSDGLVLEASRRIGAGSRTPMHLTNNVRIRGQAKHDGQEESHSSGAGGKFGLFPGLIAGFRGRNGAGDAFIVEEILMPPALPLPATGIDDLMEHQFSSTKLDGQPLQIFVAAGPYSLDSDLHFTPWHRLMDAVEQRKPDVVLLMGPFLPHNHSSLLDPNLSQMPQEIFQTHISARLRRLCDSSAQTTAILLPSTRDIVSPHAAWPQPMFDKASLNIHKRVKCLPNPCVFSINEVIFGTSTADVLRDLRAEELLIDVKANDRSTMNSGEKDHMARTVRQVMHQRHFYPLFPASTASELPLDVTHAKLAQFGEVTPDVLLLPSILTPFAKIVDGAVVVNPGQTSKGTTEGRGTFAILHIVPMEREKLHVAVQEQQRAMEDDAMLGPSQWPHAVYERARVDISRI